MQEYIFDPLGLKDTSFDKISREGRNSTLHVRQGVSGPTAPDNEAGG